MKFTHDLYLLVRRPLLQNLRNPIWLIVGFLTPIMYLLLFLPLLNTLAGGPAFPKGVSVIQIFLPGILAFVAFSSGNGAGFTTIINLKSGLIERLRVTPSYRSALLLGPIVSSAISTLFFSAVIVIISIFFGFSIHMLGLLIFVILLVLLMVLFSSLFTALAILVKEIGTLAAIANGINLPILLLSGVLLPLSIAPSWMRIIAYANPLYYVVDAGRDLAMGHIATQNVWLAFAVVVPLTLIVLWWSLRIYKKAVA
jgi:ABC-2 type transport system permease protein